MDSVESHGDWYDGITKQIDLLKETFSPQDYRRYKIDMLRCLAERIDQFSPECGQCQMFQQDMATLVQDVDNITQLPRSKAKTRPHFCTMLRASGFSFSRKASANGFIK